MLNLSRRKGESIIIGNNIIVTALGVRNGELRIGIKAPREISVHRQEVYERIQLEKQHKEYGSGKDK